MSVLQFQRGLSAPDVMKGTLTVCGTDTLDIPIKEGLNTVTVTKGDALNNGGPSCNPGGDTLTGVVQVHRSGPVLHLEWSMSKPRAISWVVRP